MKGTPALKPGDILCQSKLFGYRKCAGDEQSCVNATVRLRERCFFGRVVGKPSGFPCREAEGRALRKRKRMHSTWLKYVSLAKKMLR